MTTETPKYRIVPEGVTCVYGAGIGGGGTPCGKPAIALWAGKTPYCGLHFTAFAMRNRAKTAGKRYYTLAEHVQILVDHVDEDGVPRCGRPRCRKPLAWGGTGAPKADTASFQHNANRSDGILCVSCNSSHGMTTAPEDVWYTMSLDEDWCSDCQQVLPISDFAMNQKICRKCSARRHVDSYEHDPAPAREYSRQYYRDHTEARKRYSRQYYRTHRESRLLYARQYHSDNREARLSAMRKWRAENRDRINAYKRERAARKKAEADESREPPT